jgi:hypothetical protein
MVIGIIPKSSSVETLLNNLKEADFDLEDVSVVMLDLKLRDTIARDRGPFKGVHAAQLVERLAKLGMSPQEAKTYGDALTQGGVFVAIKVAKESEQAAKEMLQDYTPQNLRVLP